MWTASALKVMLRWDLLRVHGCFCMNGYTSLMAWRDHVCWPYLCPARSSKYKLPMNLCAEVATSVALMHRCCHHQKCGDSQHPRDEDTEPERHSEDNTPSHLGIRLYTATQPPPPHTLFVCAHQNRPAQALDWRITLQRIQYKPHQQPPSL